MPGNFYNVDSINRLLQQYQDNRQGPLNKFQAPDYRQFQPQQLDTDWEPSPIYQQLQGSVIDRSKAATAIVLQEQQNERDYQEMIRAKKQAAAARRNAVHRNPPQASGHAPGGSGAGSAAGAYHPGGPYPKLNPYAALKTINWRGHSLTLNSTAVPRFIGFLNALWRTGYRPHVIGSYANRNIAGTSTKSLHAYGFAIDIDPAQNPVTWNGVPVTILPAGVGALAAKYGLAWGGAWHGSKRDTMHFSVPWFGTK